MSASRRLSAATSMQAARTMRSTRGIEASCGTPITSSSRGRSRKIECKRYEKGTALVAVYSPRLKRIGIQNWRRASTVAGMSRQAFDAQRGVARDIAGRPASSTQWNRIGKSR